MARTWHWRTGTRQALLLIAAAIACLAAGRPAFAAPSAVPAYYFFDSTAGSLRTDSYNRGRYFAQHHPGGTRVLMLDYGAARAVAPGVWGVQSFAGGQVLFANADVLAALQSAADGVHDGYTTGTTLIAYGTNNSYMTSHGMNNNDAFWAGYYQEARAQDLSGYQYVHGYSKQGAVVGQDQEPGFDRAPISRSLADGASRQAFTLDYDFGSADGCPFAGSGGNCANGWTVADVAHVAYEGVGVPVPEIYYASPDQAAQWTVVRKWWNANRGLFAFWGATGEQGAQITPAQGWARLSNDNPGGVSNELICFGC